MEIRGASARLRYGRVCLRAISTSDFHKEASNGERTAYQPTGWPSSVQDAEQQDRVEKCEDSGRQRPVPAGAQEARHVAVTDGDRSFKAGDKVKHVTGGPVVVIDRFDVSGSKAEVSWYHRERGQKQGQFHHATLHLASLVHVDGDEQEMQEA